MIKKITFYLLIIFCLVMLFLPERKHSQKEVVFWTLQLNAFDDYMNGVISEFEKQNPDIKIIWIDVPYSEGEKRVLASLLSPNMPDLVNLTSDFSLNLARKGALYELSEEDISGFVPQLNNSLKVNDFYSSFPFYATSAVTFYNKDLFFKSGLKSVPKTYNEINELSPLVKEKTGVFAQMPTLCEIDTFLKILNKYDSANPLDFNSKFVKEFYGQYQYLYKNDFIPKESITQTHREVLEKYGAGQIVFLQAGANFLNIIKENSPNVYKKTDVAYQMTGDNGKYDCSLMTLAIPKRAKNKDQALKFAKFLLNEQNQLAFAKLSTILPTNKKTLKNEYFVKADTSNLNEKARKISAEQLLNLCPPLASNRNQKDILNLINNTTQEILLDKIQIDLAVESTAKKWEQMKD